MPRTLITLLTWNRLKLTKNTLKTLFRHNPNQDLYDLLIIDNGSVDKSLKYFRKHNYEVLSNKKNEGVFMATRKIWKEALSRKYDFILNLQNDFPCIRPIPFLDLESYLDNHEKVGFVQLNNKTRLMYISAKGKVRIKRKKLRKHVLTRRQIKYYGWERHGATVLTKSNHHFSFNPLFFRTSLVTKLVGKARKKRERQIIEQFHKTKLKGSKVKHRCFETIIRKRQPGWIR